MVCKWLSFSHRMSLWLGAVVFKFMCIYTHTHAEYVFLYIIEMTWMADGNTGFRNLHFWKQTAW